MVKAFEMPKTPPAAVAAAILDGVEEGTLDIAPDPMARAVVDLWSKDPRAVERQLGG